MPRSVMADMSIVALTAIAGCVVAIVYLWTVEPEFEATATIELTGASDPAKHAALIRSRTILEPLIDIEGLDTNPDFASDPDAPVASVVAKRVRQWLRPTENAPDISSDRDRIVGVLNGRLHIRADSQTGHVILSFRGPDPESATRMVNQITALYLAAVNNRGHMSHLRPQPRLRVFSDNGTKAIDDIDALEARYDAAARAVHDFRVGAGLVDDSDVQSARVDRRSAREKLAETRVGIRQLEIEKRVIHTALSGGSPSALESTALDVLRRRNAELEADLAQAETRLLPNHPEILDFIDEISRVQARIEAEVRRMDAVADLRLEQARIAESNLSATLKAAEKELATMQEQRIALARLEDAANAALDLYETAVAARAVGQDPTETSAPDTPSDGRPGAKLPSDQAQEIGSPPGSAPARGARDNEVSAGQAGPLVRRPASVEGPLADVIPQPTPRVPASRTDDRQRVPRGRETDSYPSSLPVARLVRSAAVPQRPRYPDPALTLTIGAGSGLLVGLLATILAGVFAGRREDDQFFADGREREAIG